MRLQETLICSFALLTCFAAAQGNPDNFPDTPENHWAFQAISDLKSDGFLSRYRDGLDGWPRRLPMSRYELAIDANVAFQHLLTIADETDDQIAALARSAESPSGGLLAKVREFGEQLTRVQPNMRRQKGEILKLVQTFRPELEALGLRTADIPERIEQAATAILTARVPKPGQAITAFPDVPAGHWASEAVKKMRYELVLFGYPDGLFRG